MDKNDWKFSFWRTAHGAEVDLLIRRGTKILYAIECKLTKQPANSDLTGLKSFNQNHPEVPCFLVAPVKRSLQISFVKVVNPKELLTTVR